MSKETLHQNTTEVINSPEAEKAQREAQERIHDALERKVQNAETAAEREKTALEAMEKARETAESAKEKVSNKKEKVSDVERPQRGPTKAERKKSFNRTMVAVQSQMSAPSRTFSKIIHNPIVEKVSDTAGRTVARPNAILSGSLSAFTLTIIIYTIAQMNGYPLSGAESIAAFVIGWIIGIVIDYIRITYRGGRREA
ncbi:MAG: hypothetical protein Q4A34_02230 [Candidatus Saccharibacteria bacterium]|nr:hypothetical protein [Candidatus Saccharibacteria bacterium]